ncbi:MAG: UDP-glucose/GDP-mannose dehydrogenase family protein [Sporolactobacillus sp.]|jgi:UDPglucose 6-dehydrogenase|nr:UDP-glucose/GDP-mannose dehydrogenase family protein [Sporolactobacillus sp.]
MNIAVIGTGYVGLVTGTALAEIGHDVTCIDVDPDKIERLCQGIPTIYEPGLETLMRKNMDAGRLHFTVSHSEGLARAEVIYLAVGTPQRPDGSANLDYVKQAAHDVARRIARRVVVVIKSTVPVGTHEWVRELIEGTVKSGIHVEVVSNPEFLREGSAVHDTFHGDRIVIGADHPDAAETMEKINAPFAMPILQTDPASAEMIKYASNAFLATKISFINEIANLCDALGANVEEVARGMGLDRRIGSAFLRAGIGYGGSCFPKDTNALVQLAGNHHHPFHLLKAVIEVNHHQQLLMFEKLKARFGSLKGKKVAVLGLAFKPNTDDMRESPALVMIPELLKLGAHVTAYDPVAAQRAAQQLDPAVRTTQDVAEALSGADCAVIITDWPDIRKMNPETYVRLMKQPIIFDGRNCYDLNVVRRQPLEYYSVGRPSHIPETIR